MNWRLNLFRRMGIENSTNANLKCSSFNSAEEKLPRSFGKWFVIVVFMLFVWHFVSLHSISFPTIHPRPAWLEIHIVYVRVHLLHSSKDSFTKKRKKSMRIASIIFGDRATWTFPSSKRPTLPFLFFRNNIYVCLKFNKAWFVVYDYHLHRHEKN